MSRLPRDTLERWIKDYGPRVLSVAEGMATAAFGAGDIFQETFLTAWEKGGALAQKEAAGAWLVQVALNIGRKELAKERRREALLAAEVTGGQHEGTEPPAVDGGRATPWLWKAVAHLPPRQRAVLLARVVDETPSREVAEAMGMKMATVRTTQRDALTALRNLCANERERESRNGRQRVS